FFLSRIVCLYVRRKKMRPRSDSDHGLFDHNREMMKQVYIIMKTSAAPGAIKSQQTPSGRSLLNLNLLPPSPALTSVPGKPASKHRQQGGYFVARGGDYGDSVTICPTHCCNPYNQLC